MENNDFESNLVELEKIVSELEKGNVPLEEAISKYTKAMELAKTCNDKLTTATESVSKIMNENGELEKLEIEE